MIVDSFAFRLKELLEHKRLTLQAVATTLDVSRPAVHKWTRGGEIDYHHLRKLAAFLGVNWIWLRYGEQARQELESAESVDLPMTDVRRRYTAEIMESEARMKLAQEGARIVTWEWNLLTDGVTYSPNVERVYGWPIASNEAFWKHVHTDDIPMMNRAYEESIRTGQPHELDFRIFQPDGGMRWICSRATPVREIDGRIVKIVGISMDNTDRKVAEQSLHTQQQRARAVLELASEGMALVGPDWRWDMANDALAKMLGYPMAELTAQPLPALLADKGARLRRLLGGKQSRATFQADLVCKDGGRLPSSVRAAVGREDDGAASYLILAIRPAGNV